MTQLGRMERVNLHDVWANEAGVFTPWLAEEENIKLLGDTIGLELEVQSIEKEVGPFRADILCKETTSDHWVLIENQLERTDHTHLGQLMTYAAGLNAVTIVWIAERFTDEHRAALDWLNERTDDNISFFGLEIELWRIGDSTSAPKFNMVCRPNEWTDSIRPELTETRQLQLAFWVAFKEYMHESSTVRCGKPQPQHWMNHSIEGSGFYLCSIASTWDSVANAYTGEIRVELQMYDQGFFSVLETNQDEIERDIGESLTWYNPEDRQICRVYARKSADITDRSRWAEWHAWLRENVEIFHRVLSPRIKSFMLEKAQHETGQQTQDNAE